VKKRPVSDGRRSLGRSAVSNPDCPLTDPPPQAGWRASSHPSGNNSTPARVAPRQPPSKRHPHPRGSRRLPAPVFVTRHRGRDRRAPSLGGLPQQPHLTDALPLLTKTGALRCVSTSPYCQKRCVLDALLAPSGQSVSLLSVVRSGAGFPPQWSPCTCIGGLKAAVAPLHRPTFRVTVRSGVWWSAVVHLCEQRTRARGGVDCCLLPACLTARGALWGGWRSVGGRRPVSRCAARSGGGGARSVVFGLCDVR